MLLDLGVHEDPLEQLEASVEVEWPAPLEGGTDPPEDPFVGEQCAASELPGLGASRGAADAEVPVRDQDRPVESFEPTIEVENEPPTVPRAGRGRDR
jgi:hypothetical protein